MPPKKASRLICRAEVLDRTSASYGSIWLWMRAGKFPRSRLDPTGQVCWLEHEVEEWILNRPIAPLKGDKKRKAIKTETAIA